MYSGGNLLRHHRNKLAAVAATQRGGPARADLRITSGFSCVACGLKPRASFSFTGCWWWRSLVVYGGPGHVGDTPGARQSWV